MLCVPGPEGPVRSLIDLSSVFAKYRCLKHTARDRRPPCLNLRMVLTLYMACKEIKGRRPWHLGTRGGHLEARSFQRSWLHLPLSRPSPGRTGGRARGLTVAEGAPAESTGVADPAVPDAVSSSARSLTLSRSLRGVPSRKPSPHANSLVFKTQSATARGCSARAANTSGGPVPGRSDPRRRLFYILKGS